MTSKDATLSYGDLVKNIRNDNNNDTQQQFPNVDAFLSEENIQLSSEIRDIWPATLQVDHVKLDNVKNLFENDQILKKEEEGNSQAIEEALCSIRAFLNETKQIPDMLIRTKDALNALEESKQKLSHVVSSVENSIPK